MGEKLQPVSWLEFVRRLKELGFEGPFYGDKHPKMKRGDFVLRPLQNWFKAHLKV